MQQLIFLNYKNIFQYFFKCRTTQPDVREIMFSPKIGIFMRLASRASSAASSSCLIYKHFGNIQMSKTGWKL